MARDFDTRVAVYAWIERDGQVLLTHWRGLPQYGVTGGWTLPGGGIEVGESVTDCLLREVYEESGYRVGITGLLGVDSFWRAADDRADGATVPGLSLRIVHTAAILGGRAEVIEVDGSTDDVAWFDLDGLDTLDTVGLVAVARRMVAAP